jgi:monoamine oxidase
VQSITRLSDHVEVTIANGGLVHAPAVVAAVPVSHLAELNVSRSLSSAKLAAASEARVSRGIKVWARVTGLPEPLGVLAPEEHPICSVQTDKEYDDGSHLVVAFGADASVPELAGEGGIEAALQQLLPDRSRVQAIHTHDWTGDELSRGNWAIIGPGSFTQYIHDLHRPEERVVLAGADIALGWHGIIDGAIESGYLASRHVASVLTRSQHGRATAPRSC